MTSHTSDWKLLICHLSQNSRDLSVLFNDIDINVHNVSTHKKSSSIKFRVAGAFTRPPRISHQTQWIQSLKTHCKRAWFAIGNTNSTRMWAGRRYSSQHWRSYQRPNHQTQNEKSHEGSPIRNPKQTKWARKKTTTKVRQELRYLNTPIGRLHPCTQLWIVLNARQAAQTGDHRTQDAGDLVVLVNEHERVGHVRVPQVDHGGPHPRAQLLLGRVQNTAHSLTHTRALLHAMTA